MCRTVTKIYECGHTKVFWYACDPCPKLGEPASIREDRGNADCDVCTDWPLHPAAEINGWDTCIWRQLQAEEHRWKCCQCGWPVNYHFTPSCCGKTVILRHNGNNIDRPCEHPICENCQGIDKNGDLYTIEKPKRPVGSVNNEGTILSIDRREEDVGEKSDEEMTEEENGEEEKTEEEKTEEEKPEQKTTTATPQSSPQKTATATPRASPQKSSSPIKPPSYMLRPGFYPAEDMGFHLCLTDPEEDEDDDDKA